MFNYMFVCLLCVSVCPFLLIPLLHQPAVLCHLPGNKSAKRTPLDEKDNNWQSESSLVSIG